MAQLKKRHEFWLALLIVVLFVGLAWRSDEFLTFGKFGTISPITMPC